MSKKRDKESSLSEKFSSLIQAKPSAIESDDEDLVTAAKITPNDNDSEYSADELDVSKFRRLNAELLEDNDNKYLGKGITRKELNNAEQSDLSESEGESQSGASDLASDKSDSDNKSDIEGEGSDSEEENDGEEEEEEGEGEDEENDNEEMKAYKKEIEERKKLHKRKTSEDYISKEIIAKATSDIEKGKAIKNQLHIWDFILECRMKFQKCLIASNQLPSHSNFPKFKSAGSSTFCDSELMCKKSLRHLLKSLLRLQSSLLNTNEEFLETISNRKGTEKDDDEITSDSDENDNDINQEKNTVTKYSTPKLKSLQDFSSEIEKRHLDFQTYRNNIIQKWNDKTRIGYVSNKNFSAFEQSTLKQIEHVLLDRERLIKRTQTKRSNYRILGEDSEPPPKKAAKDENSVKTSVDRKNKVLHSEIFDDDDFYHQLLNELVKRKASDVTDPVQLGRQWMQLQKIRSKMKKTVDTKASKGRRVRFVVHPKLVNFMMPVDNSTYNEESKTELFNSLFGKTKK